MPPRPKQQRRGQDGLGRIRSDESPFAGSRESGHDADSSIAHPVGHDAHIRDGSETQLTPEQRIRNHPQPRDRLQAGQHPQHEDKAGRLKQRRYSGCTEPQQHEEEYGHTQ